MLAAAAVTVRVVAAYVVGGTHPSEVGGPGGVGCTFFYELFLTGWAPQINDKNCAGCDMYE